MPPKVRRPAAAKGKAKAAARHRVRAPRGVLRRPGAAGADFQGGASQVKLEEWSPGLQILVTEGYYFGQKISLSGEVRSIRIGGGSTELMLLPLGSPDEDLVKWTTANPGTELQTHVCPVDCTHIPDGEGEGTNLGRREASLGPEPQGCRGRVSAPSCSSKGSRREEAERGRGCRGESQEEKEGSRRQGRKRKEEKEEGQRREVPKEESREPGGPKEEGHLEAGGIGQQPVFKPIEREEQVHQSGRAGQKPLRDLFSQTGLDPDPAVRRRIRRKVRRGIKKKKKSSSSSSSETATDSSCLSQEGLFEEDAKVKKVASRGPGLLASTAVANMQRSLLTRQGDLLEAEAGPVPAIVLNYYRQHLQNRMSGGLPREALWRTSPTKCCEDMPRRQWIRRFSA